MTEMNDYNPQIGTFGDYVPPTIEEVINEPAVSNHPVLTALNEKIARLEKELAEKEFYRTSTADQLRSARYDHDSKKLKLKDVLIDFIDHNYLDYECGKQIADIFDILLTKRIEVEYKISASVTIEVPINADEDDVANEVFCDRVDFSSYHRDYEILDSD